MNNDKGKRSVYSLLGPVSRAGVTLVELVVAGALITVVALAVLGPFRWLAISTQSSKSRTLANNLAQEQIEIIKNKSYYSLLVTTSTFNDTRFSPALSYDDSGYPVDTLVEGGISFSRATRVDFAFQDGPNITAVPWTNDDTGLKQITVYVIWRQNNVWSYLTLQNLMSNVSTSQLNARITGTVTQFGTGTNIAGALVRAVENANYYGTTNASGVYTFSVVSGSYTLTCSSTPYFSQTTSSLLSVASGGTGNQHFALTAMASAPVTTDVYLLNDIVISQVVTSTGPAGDQEYIELYNPTSSEIPTGSGACCSGSYFADYKMDFWFYDKNDYQTYTFLTYVTTYIPAGGFYLIANNPTVNAGGVTRTADAYYGVPGVSHKNGSSGYDFQAPSHMLQPHQEGGLYLRRNPGSWYVADSVGWMDAGLLPDTGTCEGGAAGCVNLVDGIHAGEQLIRFSTPGAVVSALAPAYDSDYNSRDFTLLSPMTVAPSIAGITKTAVAGYPASGSWVNYNDSLSQGGTCSTVLIGGLYPVCRYTTYVATGTWTGIAYSLGSASSNFFKQFDNVVVGASGVSIPNAATVPSWPAADQSATLLRDTTNYAFIAGYVYNVFGVPLAGKAVSGSGGAATTTSASGRYFLSLEAGAVQLTANPNSADPTYSAETLNVTGTAGALLDSQNFNLNQAGVIRGHFKTSSGIPLPNRSAVALSGVDTAGQGSSDTSGDFYLRNLSTGTYVVQPALDPMESVSPSSATVTIATPGTTVFVASFTVTNGLAQIVGRVTSGGTPITTGVFILASTTTLSGGATTPAPSMSGSTGCAPCYYETSSDATGDYVLSLRSSATAYKLYGWHTTFSGTTPTTTRSSAYTVSVTTGSATVTQDIAW